MTALPQLRKQKHRIVKWQRRLWIADFMAWPTLILLAVAALIVAGRRWRRLNRHSELISAPAPALPDDVIRIENAADSPLPDAAATTVNPGETDGP